MESRADCAELRVTWTVTQGKRTENALFRDVSCASIQLILRESGLLYLSAQPCLQTILADFRCDFPVDNVWLHEDLDHLHETKQSQKRHGHLSESKIAKSGCNDVFRSYLDIIRVL